MVLFLVDIKNGLTDLDEDVALILRRSKLPVVLVANKADDGKDLYGQYEFYKLGLGDPFCVPSQPEGKIGLPRANPRGRLRSPSYLENAAATREKPRGSHLLAR